MRCRDDRRSSGPACTEVARLRGCFGTTGERVVFSLPLDEIGLAHGGELTDVEAFTAIGTSFSVAQQVTDTLLLGQSTR